MCPHIPVTYLCEHDTTKPDFTTNVTYYRMVSRVNPTTLEFNKFPNRHAYRPNLLGTLSKDVFERRTSTGSEAFSLFICLDANKLVLLSFFSLLKTIYPRVSTRPLPNDAKSPLPVDVRRSKTLLLKLPIFTATSF